MYTSFSLIDIAYTTSVILGDEKKGAFVFKVEADWRLVDGTLTLSNVETVLEHEW